MIRNCMLFRDNKSLFGGKLYFISFKTQNPYFNLGFCQKNYFFWHFNFAVFFKSTAKPRNFHAIKLNFF